MKPFLFKFERFTDEEQSLLDVLDLDKINPLGWSSIRRIFYLHNLDESIVRGEHANRNSSFILFCIQGRCTVSVKTTEGLQEFYLDSGIPEGLAIPPGVWKKMWNFSKGAVLLVASDSSFQPDEYFEG